MSGASHVNRASIGVWFIRY